LRAANLLKSVTTAEDVRGLRVGDFIEFQASFRPDELISLMDVFNPELIAALTRWLRRKKFLAAIVATAEDDPARQNLVVEYQTVPDIDAELAKSVAEAIRVDFRSEATREYYGTIGEQTGSTAVVVCDIRNFLVEDPDRMLDGHFTVLGKVSTPPQRDVPVLTRNKVLDRIKPEAVDYVVEQLRTLAARPMQGAPTSAFGDAEATADQYLDMEFPSRIDGDSFKVVPIAIYI
jgi:hypothetical protein